MRVGAGALLCGTHYFCAHRGRPEEGCAFACNSARVNAHLHTWSSLTLTREHVGISLCEVSHALFKWQKIIKVLVARRDLLQSSIGSKNNSGVLSSDNIWKKAGHTRKIVYFNEPEFFYYIFTWINSSQDENRQNSSVTRNLSKLIDLWKKNFTLAWHLVWKGPAGIIIGVDICPPAIFRGNKNFHAIRLSFFFNLKYIREWKCIIYWQIIETTSERKKEKGCI